MISAQSILSSVFPGGIPPELYGSLPEITGHAQRLADLAAGFTIEEIEKCSLKSVKIRPIETVKTDDTVEEELSKMQIGWAAKRKLTGKLPSDANEIIASMKAQGMTHAEIGEKLGISKTTSKNRLVKWRKAQKASELYEPGAVEAAAEAKAAEATIRKYRTVEDLVKSMDRPGAFDSEILVAVKRQFPGIRLTVADIAEMRRMA